MSWMETYSGRRFYPSDPEGFNPVIEDIAHALSHICRFGGHGSTFYSVAEHSVLVSEIVPPSLAYQGLMHDATEAYLGDVPTPLKKELPDYRQLESRVWRRIARVFGLPERLDPGVRAADLSMLAREKHALHQNSTNWPVLDGVTPAAVAIQGWSPRIARNEFMARYRELTKESIPC